MKHNLRTQLSGGFALIVLVTVALISLASNLLISRQFEQYVIDQQKTYAEGLAAGLAEQYDASGGGWNPDYIHGFGMYALNDGYILKIYDNENNIVWDAENHDMTYCHQIMNGIQASLENAQPDGSFVTEHYDLVKSGFAVGHADISYYSPYYSSGNEFRFVAALNRILLAVGAFSLLGAVIAGAVLAGRIASPLSKTTESVKKMSEGNYGIRLEAGAGARELAELKQAVNQMAETLAKQEAIRQRMTADVAHELRTPVANVSSHLEAMLEGVWETTPERLRRCYEELGRISGLIDDLEELGRIENEDLRLYLQEVDLFELAGCARASFETAMKEKQLSCAVTGEKAIVCGDRQRLYQVIVNLLSNAVKYTPEGGRIRLEVKKEDGEILLIVEDNGSGIPARELPFVFERFYRADRSRNRKTGGSGIGLSIVRAIVLAHNGNVTVQSEPGRGSRFTVHLPDPAGLPERKP